MNLPTPVKIAAFDIQLEHFNSNQARTEASYGQWRSLEQKILVDRDQNPLTTLSTVLHELLHAIRWAYGVEPKDSEERQVNVEANGLTQVLRDNPHLLAWINHILAPYAKNPAD